jgi:putative chitinase
LRSLFSAPDPHINQIALASLLHALAPGGKDGLIQVLAPLLEDGLVKAAIDTPLRVAHFLGQAIYETGYAARLSENLSYSAGRIATVFPALAGRVDELAGNPEALGNAAYASRFGNGDEKSGDGFRFRGRGLFMTTFRANYAAIGREEDPDTLAVPAGAVASAIAFWNAHRLSIHADADETKIITEVVNGGNAGFVERAFIKKRALRLLSS